MQRHQQRPLGVRLIELVARAEADVGVLLADLQLEVLLARLVVGQATPGCRSGGAAPAAEPPRSGTSSRTRPSSAKSKATESRAAGGTPTASASSVRARTAACARPARRPGSRPAPPGPGSPPWATPRRRRAGSPGWSSDSVRISRWRASSESVWCATYRAMNACRTRLRTCQAAVSRFRRAASERWRAPAMRMPRLPATSRGRSREASGIHGVTSLVGVVAL